MTGEKGKIRKIFLQILNKLEFKIMFWLKKKTKNTMVIFNFNFMIIVQELSFQDLKKIYGDEL